MKKQLMTLVLILTITSLYVKSQPLATFAGKANYSLITVDEILKEPGLKLENCNGTIVGFSVIVTSAGGFENVERASGSKLSAQQKQILQRAVSTTKIYFEDIEVKATNGSLMILPSIVLIKDGVNADVYRKQGYNCLSNQPKKEIKNQKIYVYPDLNSIDTTLFTIKSFDLISYQPDKYYEFSSKSNSLTDEMRQFILTKAVNDIQIKNIKAIDTKTKETINVENELRIETKKDILFRSKKQLLDSKDIDLIAPNPNIKIKDFLMTVYLDGKENTFKSSNIGLSKEMKDFIQTIETDEIISFTINCMDSQNVSRQINIDVKLTE